MRISDCGVRIEDRASAVMCLRGQFVKQSQFPAKGLRLGIAECGMKRLVRNKANLPGRQPRALRAVCETNQL